MNFFFATGSISHFLTMVWLRATSCTMLAYYENVLYGDEGLKIRGIDNELGYF